MLPNGFVCVCIDRLALIRQQREEAAKKREEEKAGNKPLKQTTSYGFKKQNDFLLFLIFQCLCLL